MTDLTDKIFFISVKNNNIIFIPVFNDFPDILLKATKYNFTIISEFVFSVYALDLTFKFSSNNCINVSSYNARNFIHKIITINGYSGKNDVTGFGNIISKSIEYNNFIVNGDRRNNACEAEAYTNKIYPTITQMSPGLLEGEFFKSNDLNSFNLRKFSFSSSDDNDNDNLNDGAIKIDIVGYGYNDNINVRRQENNPFIYSNLRNGIDEFQEELVLTGHTPVTTVNDYWKIKSIKITEVGTNFTELNNLGNSYGDIYCYNQGTLTTNGVPDDRSEIIMILPQNKGFIKTLSAPTDYIGENICINNIIMESNIKNVDTIIEVSILHKTSDYNLQKGVSNNKPIKKIFSSYLTYDNKNKNIDLEMDEKIRDLNDVDKENSFMDLIVCCKRIQGTETDVDVSCTVNMCYSIPYYFRI